MRNQDIQRLHYDARARAEGRKVGDRPEASGAEAFWEELQAPYRFAEERLLGYGLEKRRVLDYDCGYGAASVMGLEGSISFEEGDCEALGCPDDSFDRVVSVGTLSCLELDRALVELARVTKREGHVVLVDTLAQSPLANLSRRIKVLLGQKTAWTARHTLSVAGVESAERFFETVDVHFFDLVTQPLVALRMCCGGRRLVPRPLIATAQCWDQRLLRHPQAIRYAWKVVCILSRPRKSA